jgi:VWFA-related protein
MRSFLLSFVCAGLCLINASAQQTQPPPGQPAITFKAEVNYVDVDAIVTDQQGNFVKNLTKDDFEVLEDGKAQKVEMFSFVDLPVRAVDRPDRFGIDNRTITTDIKTNEQSLAGRLYVIVLDDMDTSLFRAGVVKRTARQFIEQHLGPDDVAAVVYTSGRTDAAQEFTTDRPLLLAAVDKFVGRKLRSSTLDKIDSYFRQQEMIAMQAASADPSAAPAATNNGALSAGSSTDPSINPYTRGDGYPDRTFDSEDAERGLRALGVLNTLKDLADFMGTVHGRRKAILLFSEGIDYATNDIFGAQEASTVIKATQDAITAAARGNVSFFGIDPRGLVGMSSDMIEMASPGLGNDPLTANANLAGFAAEMKLSQDSLQSLAEETGGFSSVNANNPAGFFDRIVRANSTYYVLGYYPPSHPRDGRFHKIEVRMKRPGLKVSARKGYADPRGRTPEERAAIEQEKMAREAKKGGADNTSVELRTVLNSPMQQGGVSMLVQAAPFKGASKENTVAMAIEMDGAPFHFESRNNDTVFADNIELSYFSMNEQGKPLQGQRSQFELSLRPDTYQRVRQAGVRMNQRLALAPGRYQLRIGVKETGTGAIGTVFYDLQVPDFANEQFSMSGMLLTAGTSALVPTLVADKALSADQLPGPATSRRTFAVGDELALYAEIYDNIKGQNHTVSIVTRLVGEDGREVLTSRETRQTTAQGNREATTIGLSKPISLKDVRPGRYLLQVEARVNGNSKDIKPVTRETVLIVIPKS